MVTDPDGVTHLIASLKACFLFLFDELDCSTVIAWIKSPYMPLVHTPFTLFCLNVAQFDHNAYRSIDTGL